MMADYPQKPGPPTDSQRYELPAKYLQELVHRVQVL